MTADPPRVDLVYFNAGGGHRAAAQALHDAIAAQGRGWHVRRINLVEVLDARDRFRRFTGCAPEDLYNLRLKRGWTLGLGQELKLLQAMIRLTHATLVKLLQAHWAATAPDLVVSLIPNFNRALHESLGAARPGVPFVTVLTDMADHPPNFWIEEGQDQHLVCATDEAVEQALKAGHAPWRVHRTSGMIIRPDFYDQPPLDHDAGRRRLGLDPGRATGVVMFGGHGSSQMLTIARRLPDCQLILMCGHNEVLARRLRALPAAAPRAIVGFTDQVARHLRLGDYLIGKPGPGSLSEAVHLGLPVIVTDNAWTMPQERYNVRWVREQGVGLVLPSFRPIRQAVADLTARLPQLQARAAAVQNRAVFEVPAILARLLARAGQPPVAASRVAATV